MKLDVAAIRFKGSSAIVEHRQPEKIDTGGSMGAGKEDSTTRGVTKTVIYPRAAVGQVYNPVTDPESFRLTLYKSGDRETIIVVPKLLAFIFLILLAPFVVVIIFVIPGLLQNVLELNPNAPQSAIFLLILASLLVVAVSIILRNRKK